jgi:hypothetical protein
VWPGQVPGKYRANVVMRAVCPRCRQQAHAPTAWSSAWRCDLHGEINPLATAKLPTLDALHVLVKSAVVPVWLPWPLPLGWLVTGFTGAGDERTGIRGSAVALSGPNPLGGPADLLIIAEEPGVGLGAGLAGLPGLDPGDGFAACQPNASVKVGGHDAPLWLVESDGKAVFAGEVGGNWVWLVLWPDTAGALLVEPMPLRDLRDPELALDVPFGALSPRLRLAWPPCALTCTCIAMLRTGPTLRPRWSGAARWPASTCWHSPIMTPRRVSRRPAPPCPRA